MTTEGQQQTQTQTTQTQAQWFDGLDAETKGYLQNRGLDKKTAVEAFAEASKAHREAQKFVGAPENEILRLPKDPNAPEWDTVWERLGKPKDARDYDFSAVKFADGSAMSEADVAMLREAASEGKMTKAAADAMARRFIKREESSKAFAASEAASKFIQEKTELKKNWGANWDANKVVAEAAARALGVKPETVAALEGVVGYSQIMEMFRNIGSKIGEDRFVTSQQGGAAGVMTREAAIDEKKALKADAAWVTRYINGGREERAKMNALDRIITGIA